MSNDNFPPLNRPLIGCYHFLSKTAFYSFNGFGLHTFDFFMLVNSFKENMA